MFIIKHLPGGETCSIHVASGDKKSPRQQSSRKIGGKRDRQPDGSEPGHPEAGCGDHCGPRFARCLAEGSGVHSEDPCHRRRQGSHHPDDPGAWQSLIRVHARTEEGGSLRGNPRETSLFTLFCETNMVKKAA